MVSRHAFRVSLASTPKRTYLCMGPPETEKCSYCEHFTECPLAECVQYAGRGRYQTFLASVRRGQALQLRAAGKSLMQIAGEMGINVRSVSRLFAAARN